MSGKSPLQMLAQTCSQIGVDSGYQMTYNHQSSSDKSKSSPKSGTPVKVDINSKHVHFKPYNIAKPKQPNTNKSEYISKSSSVKSASPSSPINASSPNTLLYLLHYPLQEVCHLL